MSNIDILEAVNIVISDLEKKIPSQAGGHYYTTIRTLRDYAKDLREELEIERLEENELRL